MFISFYIFVKSINKYYEKRYKPSIIAIAIYSFLFSFVQFEKNCMLVIFVFHQLRPSNGWISKYGVFQNIFVKLRVDATEQEPTWFRNE